jgi:S1/P1 Nuclease
MRRSYFLLFAIATLAHAPAEAWGDLGHKASALVAYRHLTPKARMALDALLAADPDTLTAPDFASRATWADKFRNAHRETAAWHFVDIEIDNPDIKSACFDFPAASAGAASQGPAQDCVVNKIDEFAAELKDPAAPLAERLLALKFLIHFIADVHQPLHAADHHDRGGNCILLAPAPMQAPNLHAYWDIDVVERWGRTPAEIADKLDAGLNADQFKTWAQGSAASWAMESFDIGRRDAYALAFLPTCQNNGSITLPADYAARAQEDAAIQLLKAAVRMAAVLNEALGT